VSTSDPPENKGSATVGILVGGASSRMGTPKGRLPHPDGGTLLEHLVAACEGAYPCCLVGEATAYEDLARTVRRLPDGRSGVGPIGGLLALLEAAETPFVITVACDMPFVTASTLRELADDPRDCTVLAARADASSPWEPMLARWRVAEVAGVIRAAIAQGTFGLSRLMGTLSPERFTPSDPRALLDWDTPEDVKRLR
jgi:molybdopterin-guanine dinucleotide biosynthesis protein A